MAPSLHQNDIWHLRIWAGSPAVHVRSGPPFATSNTKTGLILKTTLLLLALRDFSSLNSPCETDIQTHEETRGHFFHQFNKVIQTEKQIAHHSIVATRLRYKNSPPSHGDNLTPYRSISFSKRVSPTSRRVFFILTSLRRVKIKIRQEKSGLRQSRNSQTNCKY